VKLLLFFCIPAWLLAEPAIPANSGFPEASAELPQRRVFFEATFSYDQARSTVSESLSTPVLESGWYAYLGASIFSPDATRREMAAAQMLDGSRSRLFSRKVRIQGAVEVSSWLDIGLFASVHRFTATGFRHELSGGANGYFLFLRQASALATAYPERLSLNLPANGLDAAYFVRGKKTFQTATNGFFASVHKRMGPLDPYAAIGATILSRNNAYAAAGVRVFTSDRFYLQLEGYSEAVRMRVPDYSAGGSTFAALREEGVRIGAGFTIFTKAN
jgi:hypothetical protein